MNCGTGWTTCGGSFDLESKETALVGLEQRMASPGFWDQPDTAREVIEQANRLKAWTEPWASLTRRVDELTELAAVSYTHLTLPTN